MTLVERLQPDSLAIFLFHGVVKQNPHPIRNYTNKHLMEDVFIRCLSALKQMGTPLGMDQVLHHCETGKAFPKNAFALTFDDGFENNWSVAAPILDAMGLPATFYLTTKFVDENAMSWIDRIEYCIEEAQVSSVLLPWNTEASSLVSVHDAIAVLQEIRFHVKRSPKLNITRLIDSLFEQCRIEPIFETDDPLDKKMSWKQVQMMHANPNFIIGGHTHTHPIMSFLDATTLDQEIDGSLNLLKEKAGISTVHYSYPEGAEHCFSETVIRQLQLRGITCCPTAIDGVNDINTDPYHFKRIMVA